MRVLLIYNVKEPLSSGGEKMGRACAMNAVNQVRAGTQQP